MNERLTPEGASQHEVPYSPEKVRAIVHLLQAVRKGEYAADVDSPQGLLTAAMIRSVWTKASGWAMSFGQKIDSLLTEYSGDESVEDPDFSEQLKYLVEAILESSKILRFEAEATEVKNEIEETYVTPVLQAALAGDLRTLSWLSNALWSSSLLELSTGASDPSQLLRGFRVRGQDGRDLDLSTSLHYLREALIWSFMREAEMQQCTFEVGLAALQLDKIKAATAAKAEELSKIKKTEIEKRVGDVPAIAAYLKKVFPKATDLTAALRLLIKNDGDYEKPENEKIYLKLAGAGLIWGWPDAPRPLVGSYGLQRLLEELGQTDLLPSDFSVDKQPALDKFASDFPDFVSAPQAQKLAVAARALRSKVSLLKAGHPYRDDHAVCGLIELCEASGADISSILHIYNPEVRRVTEQGFSPQHGSFFREEEVAALETFVKTLPSDSMWDDMTERLAAAKQSGLETAFGENRPDGAVEDELLEVGSGDIPEPAARQDGREGSQYEQAEMTHEGRLRGLQELLSELPPKYRNHVATLTGLEDISLASLLRAEVQDFASEALPQTLAGIDEDIQTELGIDEYLTKFAGRAVAFFTLIGEYLRRPDEIKAAIATESKTHFERIKSDPALFRGLSNRFGSMVSSKKKLLVRPSSQDERAAGAGEYVFRANPEEDPYLHQAIHEMAFMFAIISKSPMPLIDRIFEEQVSAGVVLYDSITDPEELSAPTELKHRRPSAQTAFGAGAPGGIMEGELPGDNIRVMPGPEGEKKTIDAAAAREAAEDAEVVSEGAEERIDEATRQSAFAARLMAETGIDLQKDEANPFMNLDKEGGYYRMKRNEVERRFKTLLGAPAEEGGCAITNREVRGHLVSQYLAPFFDKIAELNQRRANGDKAVGREIQANYQAIADQMRFIVEDPVGYGVDYRLMDTKKWPRSKLNHFRINDPEQADLHMLPQHIEYLFNDDGSPQMRVDESGNTTDIQERIVHDGDVDIFLAGLADENIDDPLFIGGRLPLPTQLADACRRVYEKAFPINMEDANAEAQREAKKLIFDRVINQVLAELVRAERKRNRTKISKESSREERELYRERQKAVYDSVEKLTQLMKDLVREGRPNDYLSVVMTGVQNPTLVQIPHLALRPRYGVEPGTDKAGEYLKFYRGMIEGYTDEEVARLRDEFYAEGSTAFFRDEAGEKEPLHLYLDMVKVLMTEGFTEEQVKRTFAPALMSVIDEMSAHQEKINAEREKGFKRDQSEIVRLTKERDVVKQRALKTARSFVRNAADVMGIMVEGDKVADPIDRLVDMPVVDGESEAEEPRYAFGEKFDDPENRIAGWITQREALEEEVARTQRGIGDNAMMQDDAYFHAREAYGALKLKIEALIQGEETPNQEEFQALWVELNNRASNMMEALTALKERQIAELAAQTEGE